MIAISFVRRRVVADGTIWYALPSYAASRVGNPIPQFLATMKFVRDSQVGHLCEDMVRISSSRRYDRTAYGSMEYDPSYV